MIKSDMGVTQDQFKWYSSMCMVYNTVDIILLLLSTTELTTAVLQFYRLVVQHGTFSSLLEPSLVHIYLSILLKVARNAW